MAGKCSKDMSYEISDSDTNEDEIPVPIQPAKGRRKVLEIGDDISGKIAALASLGNKVYTSQVLKFREMKTKIAEAPTFLKNMGYEVNETDDQVFTRGRKTASSERKQLEAEDKYLKEVSGKDSSTDRLQDTSSRCFIEGEILEVTKMTEQSASILRDFEDLLPSIPNSPRLNGSQDVSVISLDDCEIQEPKAHEISVKIRCRGTVIRIPIRSDERFSTIYQELAKTLGTEVTEIVLSLDEVTIKPSDTPESVNLKSIHFLDCYVIKNATAPPVVDDNVIELKLQSDQRWKKIVKIHMDAPMKELIDQCALEKGIPASDVVFKFDGEVIHAGETPSDLDLESGLCIDVTFLS